MIRVCRLSNLGEVCLGHICLSRKINRVHTRIRLVSSKMGFRGSTVLVDLVDAAETLRVLHRHQQFLSHQFIGIVRR